MVKSICTVDRNCPINALRDLLERSAQYELGAPKEEEEVSPITVEEVVMASNARDSLAFLTQYREQVFRAAFAPGDLQLLKYV